MTLQRKYHYLSEAAKISNCSEIDLIHLGSQGLLPIYWLVPERLQDVDLIEIKNNFHGPSSIGEGLIEDIVQLPPHFLHEVECDRDAAIFSSSVYLESSMSCVWASLKDDIYFRDMVIVIYSADLVTFGLIKENEENSDRIDLSLLPKNLHTVIQAYYKYWVNADPNEKDTWPNNKTVIDWLLQNGLSKEPAKNCASLIRPNWASNKKT